MATPSPSDRAPSAQPTRRSLGSVSPAEIAEGIKKGTTRDQLFRELRLWLVAGISAGAGALAMWWSDGSWAWSIAAFTVVFLITFFFRSQYERKVKERRAAEAADLLAAKREAARTERAPRSNQPRSRGKSERPHKPRANPYRKKKD